MKKCGCCNEVKDFSCFQKDGSKKDGLRTYCRDCIKAKDLAYRQANPDKLIQIWRRSRRKYAPKRLATNKQCKRVVIEQYGGRCSCCGETQIEFLVIDHLNGGGNAHRKTINVRGGIPFYQHLIRNDFPSGYRVLCWNCNSALGCFGYCPHESDQKAIVVCPTT